MIPGTKKLTVDDWSLLRSRLFWCYDGLVKKEFRAYSYLDMSTGAWFLRKGSVTLECKGEKLEAKAGEWMLLAGEGPRKHQFSKDAHIISLSFSMTWPSGLPLIEKPKVVPGKLFPQLLTSAEALDAFFRRCFHRVRANLSQHPVDLLHYFDLERHFAEWKWHYLQAAVGKEEITNRLQAMDPRVISALKTLERLPWGEIVHEEDLAGKQGLSAGHLNRLFIRDVGLTPHAYFQKRRLECTLAKLAEGLSPIKGIAYELGFISPAHFTRWFRKMHGMPPRAFIRMHAAKG